MSRWMWSNVTVSLTFTPEDLKNPIFPELNSANIGYKLMRHLGKAEVVGPILIGMNRPVSVLERDCSVRTVVNMAAITVVHAQEMAREGSQ